MRVHLVTLGCPKNIVDSEGMAAQLATAGHILVDEPRRAELIIVNTCGFIEPARQEALDVLRELGRAKRRGQWLIAAGCLAQRWGEQLTRAVPKIDGLLGTRRWAEINDLLRDLDVPGRQPGARPMRLGDAPGLSAEPAAARAPAGPSAYLKIADGCSAPCAFCAIPLIKGPAHSRPPARLAQEARQLVAGGARELVLIAQDTTAYGRDLGLEEGLPALIEQILAAAPGLDWLRLMYAYPQQITPRLIDVMAGHPQVCHYLDLPLQHGHPDVLRRMRRPHDVEAVVAQIERLRAAMPDIVLRTSLIVGYPGETEAEFDALLAFVERIAFDRVGAFLYSPEADTPAATLPDQVDAEVKEERFDRLMARQLPIARARNLAVVGRSLPVLVEGSGEGVAVGRTYRDAPEVDGFVIVDEEAAVGTLRPARITEASDHDLWASWEPA